MKCKYKLLLGLIIIFGIGWVVSVSLTPFGDWPRLEKVIQGMGMFLAVATAIIALAVADRKKEQIRVEIGNPYIGDAKKPDQEISQDIIDTYSFESISDISDSEIKKRYKDFDKPIKFYIVNFQIKNTSNFTWKNPTFTYRTPINQRYLIFSHKDKSCKEDLPHTNYHILRREYWFVSEDKDIFTLTNLPYINHDEVLTIWFTLFLDSEMKDFDIEMSINCENAEGITEKIEIKPKELINRLEGSRNK